MFEFCRARKSAAKFKLLPMTFNIFVQVIFKRKTHQSNQSIFDISNFASLKDGGKVQIGQKTQHLKNGIFQLIQILQNIHLIVSLTL